MYKKIFALLSISALFYITQLHAQWYVGVEAGANHNYLMTSTADKPFLEYQPSNGYSVGIPIRYAFPSLEWFGGIQAVPTFVNKNYRIQRTGYYSAMYQQTNNNYLELPVMTQFRFGGHFGKTQTQALYGMLNLGGYAGYWMSGHVKGAAVSPMDPDVYQSFDQSYTFSSQKDRRYELGVLAGIGLQYMPNQKYVFSIEGRYNRALTDRQKAYQVNQTPVYNDTYSILLGMQYQLQINRHKKSKTSKE